jgi:MoxR-like ATPase
VLVPYGSRDDLNEVIRRTTRGEFGKAKGVMDAEEVLAWRLFVREVTTAPAVADYATRLILATHPGDPFAPENINQYVRFGASPRGAQGLILMAKVNALLSARYNVSFNDISRQAHSVLRHRMIRNFEAEADSVTADALVDEVVASTQQEDLLTRV